jgi:hypothetical protein
MATTTRTIRVSDPIWTAAQRTADQINAEQDLDGDAKVTMTSVVISALLTFIREHSGDRLVLHHDQAEGDVGIDPWTVHPDAFGGWTAFAYRARRSEPGRYARVLRVVSLTAEEAEALGLGGGGDDG